MKWALIIVACIDVLLLLGAGVRFATSTGDTPPLIDIQSFISGGNSSTPEPADASFGETGTSGEVAEHLKGRSWEYGETAGMVGSGGNAEYSGDQFNRAQKTLDSREGDLDDAKSKMGKLVGGD